MKPSVFKLQVRQLHHPHNMSTWGHGGTFWLRIFFTEREQADVAAAVAAAAVAAAVVAASSKLTAS